MEKQETTKNPLEVLRLLPSVDSLLHSETSKRIILETGAKHLTLLVRNVIELLRLEIQEKFESNLPETGNYSRESLFFEAEKLLGKVWQNELHTNLKRVINATGVVVHTNLGRAPLSEKAKKVLFEEVSNYCNLEYNIETGKRGKRGAKAEHLLAELTGAEAALIVNNCAAACVLVLTALCNGAEAIVSRGELVEIGGDFRVPDVMIQSGAKLVEVGTTNRTRAGDYERAITSETRLLIKVHPSNFRITGFTATPTIAELSQIAHRNNLLLYEDAGSGALFDVTRFGITDEPIISQSVVAGADVVTFSGDKLLGGIQSGLIVGKREVINVLRKHPLYRALRVSKLVYGVLEATLEAFRHETVFREIPVLRMLSLSESEIKQRIWQFAGKLRNLRENNADLKHEVIEGKSVIGGGTSPAFQPKTFLLSLKHDRFSVSKLEKFLRHNKPPIITRILEDKVLIDLRTVSENEEEEVLQALAKI